MNTTATGSYASVNGLNMYYEVHGSGQPLLLLHGAYMTIESAFGALLPAFARTHQAIAVDQQGHGRTADVERPLTYEGMADDAAALLRLLGVENADVFGYSMGGGTALQLAIRHPRLVRKLVVASATYKSAGLYPELFDVLETMTPADMAGSPWAAEYARLAPNPSDWPVLVEKLKALDLAPQDWPAAEIQAIAAPTLLIIGDADGVRPEHAVEMLRLLGGGVMGDLAGLPRAQLAVFPGTTHVGVIQHTDLLLSVIPPFLTAPMPAGNG